MIDDRPLARAFLEQRARLLRYLAARGAGDAAEDLLHELWVRVDAAGEVAALEPAAYLMRMAHNLMLDRARGERRRMQRERHFERDGETVEAPPDALRHLLARERLCAVDALLRALGPRTEQIFRLHRIECVAQREIAVRCGLSLSAVEKHLQKAYRALHDLDARPDDDAVAAGGTP